MCTPTFLTKQQSTYVICNEVLLFYQTKTNLKELYVISFSKSHSELIKWDHLGS